MDRHLTVRNFMLAALLAICLSYLLITSEVLMNGGPMKNTEINPLGRVSIFYFYALKRTKKSEGVSGWC